MAGKQEYTSEKIIQALKDTNGLVSLAAKRLSCSPQTIYNRAKQVQSVQAAIDESREELVDYAELALRSAVIGKEPWAVQFVLKTIGKHRGYIERQELTGAGGGPVKEEITIHDGSILRKLLPELTSDGTQGAPKPAE
jgi:hypothetical protein